MKKITIVILIFFISITCGCQKQESNIKSNNNKDNIVEENKEMAEFTRKINITINNKTFSATLEDNETTREFIQKLPLNITMNELNGNEKYYYFNSNLPSNPSKVGKINSGDIMLYGSDCLVLFYDSFNTSYSYTRIGSLDNASNLKEILGNGNVNVNISITK